jgi:hypothetical protein
MSPRSRSTFPRGTALRELHASGLCVVLNPPSPAQPAQEARQRPKIIDHIIGEKERPGLALTARGREFVLEFREFAAFLANSLVFLLIGSAMATIDFAREGFFALTIVVALALLGRAVAVYPICLAFARSRWAVPLNQQHLL